MRSKWRICDCVKFITSIILGSRVGWISALECWNAGLLFCFLWPQVLFVKVLCLHLMKGYNYAAYCIVDVLHEPWQGREAGRLLLKKQDKWWKRNKEGRKDLMSSLRALPGWIIGLHFEDQNYELNFFDLFLLQAWSLSPLACILWLAKMAWQGSAQYFIKCQFWLEYLCLLAPWCPIEHCRWGYAMRMAWSLKSTPLKNV